MSNLDMSDRLFTWKLALVTIWRHRICGGDCQSWGNRLTISPGMMMPQAGNGFVQDDLSNGQANYGNQQGKRCYFCGSIFSKQYTPHAIAKQSSTIGQVSIFPRRFPARILTDSGYCTRFWLRIPAVNGCKCCSFAVS
ncbi:hypothetical protein SAMN04487861_102123 [Selenomonas ruminantium]|uniref:Uncharacterized protein n=1 Tax=Selenomonas ruminantium TaxID=971 RepID=A0A1I3C356_SELRU|nr:hypothetical protein SAMN04487861_102123 [Selenomonas ruminantium]